MTLVSHSFDGEASVAFPDATGAEPASVTIPPPVAEKKATVTIQLRRGSKVAWAAKNPRLAEGEPAYETDTGREKIGDGVTFWVDLPYSDELVSSPLTQEDLDNHINSESPHPVYDNGPSLFLLYQNAKVG